MTINTSETALVHKFETTMSDVRLDIASNSLQVLKKLARDAEAACRVQVENLVLIVKELYEMRCIQQQQLLAQMSEKHNECLRYICLTNPGELSRSKVTCSRAVTSGSLTTPISVDGETKNRAGCIGSKETPARVRPCSRSASSTS